MVSNDLALPEDLASLLPIDFHCHGVGYYDFARPRELDFLSINDSLGAKRQRAILTLFVEPGTLSDLEAACRTYHSLAEQGAVPYILGLGLEGPLTSTPGGTPTRCHWAPSCEQWRALASLGSLGLRYVVISPDADPNPTSAHGFPRSIEWIMETVMDGRVIPALGHFSKRDPEESAKAVYRVIEIVGRRRQGPIFTDHLFNDMPLLFKHAWRTDEEVNRRSSEFADLEIEKWNRDNLHQRLGPVPAALIDGALSDSIRISMNFDGAHVDHAICKRIVELVGSARMMLMTDSIASRTIDGIKLVKTSSSPLLRQPNGMVAGSASEVWEQVANLMRIGISRHDIYWLCQRSAECVLSG